MGQRQINLQELPRFGDKLSYLYVEHAVVDRKENAVAFHRSDGTSLIPAAALGVLFLGPGCSITHEAVKTLADNNCLVLWVGEHGVRFYAQGLGMTRSARNVLRQAALASHPTCRLQVVVRMYCLRFDEPVDPGTTLQQLRGKEGIRVREAYAKAARDFGVDWHGRNYKRDQWGETDVLNRALSCANSCLYGLCHSAILSAGYSPALGFVHSGKQLSFVYDIADLYKSRYTVPVAFRTVAESHGHLESRVRRSCRDAFRADRLMEKVLPDIAHVLNVPIKEVQEAGEEFDGDAARPAEWWTPDGFGADTPIGNILAAAPR